MISCSKEIKQDELRVEIHHGENIYSSDLIFEPVLGGLRAVLLYRQRIPDKKYYKAQNKRDGSAQEGSSANSSLSQDVSRGGSSSLGSDHRANPSMNSRMYRGSLGNSRDGRAGRGSGSVSRGGGHNRDNFSNMTDGGTDESRSGDMEDREVDMNVMEVSDGGLEELCK
jgi:hypothetical protein